MPEFIRRTFCRRQLWPRRAALALALVLAGLATGCGKSPPATTDPAKAPWLYDPQLQIKGLADKDHRIRGVSAFNLGNMGTLAADAVPDLEKLANSDPNPKVRDLAGKALVKIRSATGGAGE